MEHVDVLHALVRTSIFRDLTVGDLREHLLRFEHMEVPEGSVVLEEGKSNSALYMVVRGSFRVVLLEKSSVKEAERFTDIELGVIRAGTCFGEFSLFDRAPASATVLALEPSEVVRIERGEIEELLGASPHVAAVVYQNMIRVLIGRIRRTDRNFDLRLALG